MEQIPKLQSFWHRTLYSASNGTGLLSRDRATEGLIRQIFHDIVKKDLAQRNKVLGLSIMDPLWLYPIGPIRFKKKGLVKGTLTACDLRLHNFKTVQLHNVEVRRELRMKTMAIRVVFKVPISWMSGYYRLENAKVFSFIPVGGNGNFNVDLKFITIEVVATLKATEESLRTLQITTPHQQPNITTTAATLISHVNGGENLHIGHPNVTKNTSNTKTRKLACLDVFEVGIHWRKAAFKFDGLWKGFRHLTDFSLNQFGLGDFILKNKKGTITTEIKMYIRRLADCLLHHIADGIDQCMIKWWENRGWTYPWTYPVCQ